MNREELFGWLALKAVPGLGDVLYKRLIEKFGSPHAVFAAPELTRDTKPIRITAFFDGLKQRSLRNDLEPVVSKRYPEVAHHLAWLKQHGEARMSGSGACVYAEFSNEAAARAAHAHLPQGMRGLVARGLERHPLHDLTE